MTVPSEVSKMLYEGNGATSVFPYTFRVLDASHLLVTEADANGNESTLQIGTDYAVSGVTSYSGGNVTLTAPLADGHRLAIRRVLPVTQPVDFRNGGQFFAETHEDAFDRLTMIAQQVNETVERSIRLAETVPDEVADGIQLPAGSPNKYIGWNFDGTKLENKTLEQIAVDSITASWVYDLFTAPGSVPSFVLRAPPGGLANLDVSVDGAVQIPGVDYTLSGQTLTFYAAPSAGEKILVRYGSSVPEGSRTVVQEVQEAANGQTAFNLTSEYVPGTNTIAVFMNGLRLTPGVDYVETDATTVTLQQAAVANDVLHFVYGAEVNGDVISPDSIPSGAISTDKIADAAVSLAKLSSSVQASLSAAGVPTGCVLHFAAATPPAGWLECNGAAVSRTTYAALFAVTGTTFGTGDGSTTFNLPDLRGEFLRGWDNGRGVDAGRTIGSLQEHALGSHRHYVAADFFSTDGSTSATITSTDAIASRGGGGGAYDEKYALYDAPSVEATRGLSSATGGTETRPRNVALLPCIKV